jgi:homoserine dehydrogenase
MSTEAARIGLLGVGTVGSAFRDLVAERAEAIAASSGRRPEIAGVLRRSEGDFDRILEDSEIVVELIGGTDPAREYVLRALRAGRHVVTANKQLLAQFGDELFEAARDAGVQLRFEAAVAGVVPVIRVIQESLAATEITKVFGIVNGTTNFILSEMASTGATYADVLGRARSWATRRPIRPTTSMARTPRRRWRSSPALPSARRWRWPTSRIRASPRSSRTTSPTPRSSACR